MPSPHRTLTAVNVADFVRSHCFAPAQNGRVGVELEQVVIGAAGRSSASHDVVARAVAALGPLPGGSRVTFEPGGQLEISSPPGLGPLAACDSTTADLAVVEPVVRALGHDLVGVGLHPEGRCTPVVDHPRYRAMAAYFAAQADGGCGRTMMCDTASLQVNLDVGDETSQLSRWRLVHLLGPVVLAAFANSPLCAGVPTGMRSGRAAVWAGIDATRTAAAGDGHGSGAPGDDWTRYVLAARVMLMRIDEGNMVAASTPMSFARWVDQGHELGYPTLDDLEYHLSTLFPPVRPRGWLELRMIDSLPDPWWKVAVAVCAALLDDAEAAEAALLATEPAAGLWAAATSHGLAHPVLAGAARTCFSAALDALPRIGASELVPAVAAFNDRFVERGRCPADEILEARNSDDMRIPVAAAAEAG